MQSNIAQCSTQCQVETGIVITPIGPDQAGRVECRASSWPAKLWSDAYPTILTPNTKVVVVDQEGITLLVAPQEALIGDRSPILNSQQRFFSLAQLFG